MASFDFGFYNADEKKAYHDINDELVKNYFLLPKVQGDATPMNYT